MTYWPFWLGGLSLALVMVLHWFGVGRMMAVSGRLTAIVDRIRHHPDEGADEELSEAELLAAMRAVTEAEFGASAVAEAATHANPHESVFVKRPPQPFWAHPLLFAALASGGLLAGGTGRGTAGMLRSTGFMQLVGHSSWVGSLVLVLGGALVGFGTRMAGGCTSGHGLCGTSRGQRGSLLATAAFFGAGVVTSFLLGGFL